MGVPVTLNRRQVTINYLLNFIKDTDVSAQIGLPEDVTFKPDGSQMYVLDRDGDIQQYALSSIWDITTKSTNGSANVSSQESNPKGIAFKPDGTKMYVAGASQNNVIYEFDVTTPWDISTLSFVTSKDISADVSILQSIFVADSGESFYITDIQGSGDDFLRQYSLSNSWDVTTMSLSQSRNLTTNDGITFPYGARWGKNENEIFVVAAGTDKLYYYKLSSGDISTMNVIDEWSVSGQDNFMSGLYRRSDGEQVYLSGLGNAKIFEYKIVG